MASLNPHIIEDIKAVAKKLGQSVLSRAEYAQKGKFTLYQIYDGGTTWEQYCLAAGFATRKKEAVPDEVYFDRLRKAHGDLGRFPKASERKKFRLNFSKRRYPTLSAFTARAAELGFIRPLRYLMSRKRANLLSRDHRPRRHHRSQRPSAAWFLQFPRGRNEENGSARESKASRTHHRTNRASWLSLQFFALSGGLASSTGRYWSSGTAKELTRLVTITS